MSAAIFPGRLAVQQRVLPVYRAPLFDMLAEACSGGLSVFAGQPLPGEQIPSADDLHTARLVRGRNWHLFDISSRWYQCWQPGLNGWLRDWKPDALIIEANPRYHSTPAAVRWMKRRNCPVLGWGLGAPPVTGQLAGWRTAARQQFLLKLDGMIAYSQRGAAEYVKQGFPSDRVFVARRPEVPPPARPADFDGPPRVLFVGRLQKRKRIDLLLQACAGLPLEIQPRLMIVGDGPARSELESLARQIYPLAEFPGALYGPELKTYFNHADLFVLPGTGGLAVQQALAAGLPVIVAQGDGTQDDTVRPENGWILPDDSQTTLA